MFVCVYIEFLELVLGVGFTFCYIEKAIRQFSTTTLNEMTCFFWFRFFADFFVRFFNLFLLLV